MVTMRSSVGSASDFCEDSKECACVICYFKYVHRIWFASQPRLLEMYAPKDKELFTKSRYDKFAASTEEASACRDKFMVAHGIICEEKIKQKRREWRVSGSNARAFGTMEDLIYMWFNMDMSLPEESYRHATSSAPPRHHPLPYLPESLRVKLYPTLSARKSEVQQMARFLGAIPPHPKIKAAIQERSVELSVSLKIQSQNCRRVAIEIWRRGPDDKRARRLGPEDLKSDGLREIHSSLQSEMLPEYMRPQPKITSSPEENLSSTLFKAHDLDYGTHRSDPGPYKKHKTISGTVTPATLICLFQKAQMDSETIFLDIGSGMGEPMIVAARGFQVLLSLGFEVHKNRVEESLRCILEHGVSRAFPLHVSVEEICHFDPVTHVYCYTNGMDSCARNCIRESILSSKSVQFVMTDRKDLLRYDSSEVSAFEQVDVVPMTMAASGGHKQHFFVLKRVEQRTSRDPRIKTDVKFHPIFALPIYMLRFDKAQEQAFLMEYVYMLARFDYTPLYFCAMKQKNAVVSEDASASSISRIQATYETRLTTKRKKCILNVLHPSPSPLPSPEAVLPSFHPVYPVHSVPRRPRLQRRCKPSPR